MTDQMIPADQMAPGAPPAAPQGPGVAPPLDQVPPVPGPGDSAIPAGPGVAVNTMGQMGAAGTMMLTPQEAQEVELRDHLGMELAQAAIQITKQAAQVSTGDPGQCKDMAQAALYLTEALVLVAPLESSAEVTGPGGPPGPGGAPVPLPPKHSPPQTSTWIAEQQATGRTA